MEPIGIFVGTWVDLSKKKTNVDTTRNISEFSLIFPSPNVRDDG
jgi:hypothetical protein